MHCSALGWANTAMAAVFSKLGVPIKTAVSAAVLETAYEGRFAATPLSFGQRVQDKVEKQAAKFYELSLSQVRRVLQLGGAVRGIPMGDTDKGQADNCAAVPLQPVGLSSRRRGAQMWCS